MKICIIGNSKRLQVLSDNLVKSGFVVKHFKNFTEIDSVICDDFVVLPVPTIGKNGCVNIDNSSITLDELYEKISNTSYVISCGASRNTHTTIDLNSREEFAYLNAIPTAEGAIYYTLENTERSLFESRVLITGFGRVAKLLADRLRLLCPNITIAARSSKDLSYAEAIGYKCVKLKDLKQKIDGFDIIFQTVPFPIITNEIIEKMDKEALIIELSSKSVGTDYIFAEAKGLKVVHAAALPEKIAPVTAGNILTKSVLSIIDEYNNSIYSE